jgi:uncharacterized protein (TIGR02246 family)
MENLTMKILPIIVVLILAGCIKQANVRKDTIMSKQTEDIAAIKQLGKDWSAGWLSGDPETLLALLTDEPALIMSSEDPIIGTEAIRTLYQYVFENYTFASDAEFTRTTDVEQMEVEVDGDLGYIWSSYTNTETPKAGGETIADHGQAVSIVRRQHDGSWKFARLIINRSQPSTDNQ